MLVSKVLGASESFIEVIKLLLQNFLVKNFTKILLVDSTKVCIGLVSLYLVNFLAELDYMN